MLRQGQLHWHHLPTKSHENPPATEAGDLISLLSFLESSLKIMTIEFKKFQGALR
jgi:hypothetical protein